MLLVIAMFAAALCLDGMLFFSAVIAPLVFTKLPADSAGAFIREVFPWYYLYVAGTSAVAALGLLALNAPAAALMAIVCGLALYARQILMPRIDRLREASRAGDQEARVRFRRGHRISVFINAGQILVVAAVFVHGLL